MSELSITHKNSMFGLKAYILFNYLYIQDKFVYKLEEMNIFLSSYNKINEHYMLNLRGNRIFHLPTTTKVLFFNL